MERDEVGRPQPHRALDGSGPDRVNAVEHDEFHPRLCGGLYRQPHRRNVGVKPAADVLNVEDEGVQPGELFRQRLACLAVQAEDFQAAIRIGAVTKLFIELAEQPVLGTEQRLELYPIRLEQKIKCRVALTIVAGVVGDQSHTAILW